MTSKNEIVECLISELLKIVPEDYLISETFSIRVRGSEFVFQWNLLCNIDSEPISLGHVSIKDKAANALKVLCRSSYKNGANSLYEVILWFIRGYCEDQNVKCELNKIKDYLTDLGLNSFIELDQYSGTFLDISVYNNIIKDYNKLLSLKEKLEKSIISQDYNYCNTLCYSILEGVYKGYCSKFQLDYNDKDEITKLAGTVKSDIKKRFQNQIVSNVCLYNQISSIANNAKEIRDHYSDSHFDGDSDKLSSSFLKDLTISVSNFIMGIISPD